MFIIILYKLVDLIEVVWIKIVTLNAEVSFDRFGKELHFISISLGEQSCWPFGLWKFLILRQD